jgi:protein TonB
MTPPRLLAGPAIEYTDEALEHEVEGVMIVRCILSTAGEVKECEVKQSVPFMDEAVVVNLQRRRYTPVTLEGKPVAVYFNFRIRLVLPR